MAQHIPIDENYVGDTERETEAIRKIVQSVKYDMKRCTGGLKGSLKWRELSNEYCFNGSDAAYLRGVDPKVPATLVVGGRAAIEAHTKGGELYRIYLVA